MNIEFECGLGGNYLIITDEKIDTADGELCMLLNNKIPGFLFAQIRTVDDRDSIYYDTASMISLYNIAKRQEFKYKEISEIIKSLMLLKKSTDEYLLSENGIIMSPEYVFFDAKEHNIKYCFYPFYNKNPKDSLNELAEFLLKNTDHADNRAVKIVYELYIRMNSGSCGLCDLILEEYADAPVTKQYINEKITCSNTGGYAGHDEFHDKPKRRNSRLFSLLLTVTAACLTAIFTIIILLDLW